MNDSYALGVDIGGSHIAAALVDIQKRILLPDTLVRNPVDSAGSKEHIIEAWSSTIRQSLHSRQAKQVAIGVAMPGPFDYENGISLISEQKKFRSLYGVSVKKELAAKLGMVETDIHFLNDACSFLVGEVLAGVAKNKLHVIGITLGTGLGSAVFSNDSVMDADLWKYKFKSGIAEDYLSTRWFVDTCRSRFGLTIAGVKELAEVAPTDAGIRKLFEEFGENLGLFVAEVQKRNMECDTVVIGGNISKAGDLFLGATRQYLAAIGRKLNVSVSLLGEIAAMTGAAGFFQRNIFSQQMYSKNDLAKIFIFLPLRNGRFPNDQFSWQRHLVTDLVV